MEKLKIECEQKVLQSLETALHQAIKNNQAAEFEQLFDCNQLGKDYCFTQIPPLIAMIQHLVQENFVSAVELVLMSKVPCSTDSSSLKRAFDYACRNDLSDVLRRFVSATIARTISFLSLDEAFELSMEKGLYDLALEISNDEAFDLNEPSAETTGPRRRRSPMHWAVFCEHPRLLDDFLNRGAIVDSEDRNGLTPLALACQLESYDCCLLLLNHGADPNRDSQAFPLSNRSPLAACVSPWYHDFTPSSERNSVPRVVRILLLMRRAGLCLNRILEVQRNTGIDISDHRPMQITDSLAISGLLASPLTLEEECGRLIRRHLAVVSHGLSIAKHLDGLPLPEIVKTHFLQLK